MELQNPFVGRTLADIKQVFSLDELLTSYFKGNVWTHFCIRVSSHDCFMIGLSLILSSSNIDKKLEIYTKLENFESIFEFFVALSR